MSRRPCTVRRPWSAGLTLLALGLAAGAGAVLWMAVHTSSVIAVGARVESLQPVFTAIRLLAIVLAALLWPLVLRRLHRRGRIDLDTAVRLRTLRGRLVLWLVVIELVLGQDLPGRLLGGGP